jgi:hypothetical protein
MATQVQLRRGTAAQNDAFTGAQGELSYDTTNKRLRVHDGATAGGFEIKTEDLGGDVSFADNEKAIFGDESDLQIYHDGSNSRIQDTATGSLILAGTNFYVNNTGDSKSYIAGLDGGTTPYVRLYYDGATRLDTTSTGATISGDVGATTASITGKTTTNELDLNAIAKDITDTAVDVFVYRTANDSDGGSWRKRTQHTSWYNETLNTATRGSRKEFPAVAVIVAETNQVTIYDGDDPDMPMWMVFNQGSDYRTYLARTQAAVTSVSALNGVMAVGRGNGGYDEALLVMSFIEDGGKNYGNSANSTWTLLADIANRNTTGISIAFDPDFGQIVNLAINDVAMTVLPNAPIDAATGLPVPTIAVASDGGVSVIKDDGTVVDITGGSQGSDMPLDAISFVGNHSVMFSHRYASEVSTIPSSDSNAAYYNQVPTFTGRITNSISHHDDTHLAALSSDNNIESIAIDEDNAVSKSVSGVSRHNHFAISGDTDRASAFITSSYNTGWMNGAIKLATLSDTDDTDVTGSELVTNGTFASDTSGWTQAYVSVAPTTFSSVSGQLVARRGDQYRFCVQQLTVEVGKTYTVSVDSPTGDNLMVGKDSNSNQYGFIQTGAAGTGSVTFTATQTALYIMCHTYKNQTTDTIFDNISVRLAEEDRSVNGNGLQVFGSITKNPVASGADLVAYSGFSTSNYLRQPVNADMQGANNKTFMSWFKTSSTSAFQYLLSFGNESNSSYGIAVRTTNGVLYAYDTVNGTNDTTSVVTDGLWHHVVLVDNGKTKKVYLDGVLIDTFSISAYTVDTDEAYYIGIWGGTSGRNHPFLGSLALQRFSHTLASPEQIAKIYEDEKVLFQENAQATLYAASPASGSPDAVTALAYDDTTELLHVGTDNGRSVFQGLRRVDNTTDAVGAAISASNGLVAED